MQTSIYLLYCKLKGKLVSPTFFEIQTQFRPERKKMKDTLEGKVMSAKISLLSTYFVLAVVKELISIG